MCKVICVVPNEQLNIYNQVKFNACHLLGTLNLVILLYLFIDFN